MKDIKFRLKDRHNKIVGYEKWYPGSYVSNYHYWVATPCWLYSEDGQHWNPTPIAHSQKDQYTDLKDKKGKEGYHHDLLKHPGRNQDKPIEIIWYDGAYWGKYAGKDFQFPLNQWEMDQAEIIGNIHENPELINCPTNADISHNENTV